MLIYHSTTKLSPGSHNHFLITPSKNPHESRPQQFASASNSRAPIYYQNISSLQSAPLITMPVASPLALSEAHTKQGEMTPTPCQHVQMISNQGQRNQEKLMKSSGCGQRMLEKLQTLSDEDSLWNSESFAKIDGRCPVVIPKVFSRLGI